jgi:tetratricopeptide (TPR) repeat protein
MSEPPLELEAFRKLLEATSISSQQQRPILESDALVGPELGPVLRRCAVPHEFDRALLALLGESDQQTAAERFETFSDLSLMQVANETLSVHERWRRPLWAWWLREEQRPEFVALSRSLADWFDGLEKSEISGGQRREVPARKRMFHRIGCDPDKGIAEFESLCRTARHNWAFPECNLLIRLVKEYEPVLNPRQRAILGYHEGKLASDLHEWERALATFRSVEADPAVGAVVQIKAMVRAAHALRNLGRNQEALKKLQEARDRTASSGDAAALSWRVHYELGEVFRDLGDLDRAERTLRVALDEAGKASEEAELAGVLSSLGTVQSRLRNTSQAIESFQLSLKYLERSGEALRTGAVLNNLGVAQLEKTDWAGAQISFAASLERARAAGDRGGQATAMFNSSRAQVALGEFAAAKDSAEQATKLFAEAGDDAGAKRALSQIATIARARLLRSRPRGVISRAIAGLARSIGRLHR